MPIHALGLEEFEEEDFFLIAIHTSLEDFRLAYLLNVALKMNLERSKNCLNLIRLKKKVSFSVFSHNSSKYEDQWDLISNRTSVAQETETNTLPLNSDAKAVLIPEQKKIDYFIKITGNIPQGYIKKTVRRIQSIDQIITSYYIDKNTLKSKEYLIF